MPYVLVSRSAEYETKLRALLGARLKVVTGEFLTFGPESVLDRVGEQPRIALLGPVLNYEETRALIEGLTERHPDIGLVVVREQRSDLEDWVDELSLHAVLSPAASDETTTLLLDRLANWLITTDKASASDFEMPELLVDDPGTETVGYLAEPVAVESDRAVDFDVLLGGAGEGAAAEAVPAEPEWVFPPDLESGTRTEVIAVVAPKGGQGKTTLAINLATGLAEVAPNSVVLVDADLQFGDITAALALDPQRTIVDAVAFDATDELVLKTTLTHHDDGFFVIASAPSPELGDSISAPALAALVQRLRTLFRYVIVDTTPGLGEHTLTTIEHSTDAVFVSNMGVPSLRALRTEFELLKQVGLLPANRHVVVNFTDKLSGITIKDAENILGTPVSVDVPRSSAVLLASNRGIPLIHDDVNDAASKAIRSLIRRIAPAAVQSGSKIRKRRRSRESE
ncbi:AAA family ATPase [Streptomyces sp. ISL-90]|nr:AAA family ATPase [Streptomyces sp. ISL-90]